MNITIVAIAVLGVLVWLTYLRLGALKREWGTTISRGLEALSERLEAVEQKLTRVEEQLSQIEYNMLSPDEKICYAFDESRELPLSELHAVKKGDTWWMVEKSYYYPSVLPVAAIFEYKHDHVNETRSSRFGHEVQGFRRWRPQGEWEPYQFLASEKEALTPSCGGTLRRLRGRGLALVEG